MNRYKEILRMLAKPLGLLLVLIMICAFLARSLSGSETLAEYAQKNPEIAYRTEEPAAEPPADTAEKDTDSETQMAEAEITQTPDKPAAYNTREDTAGSTRNDLESENKEDLEMNEHPDRVTYQPGFYYEPLDQELIARITGISYPVPEDQADDTAVPAINIMAENETPAVSYDDLRYVSVLYIDFNAREQEGELICNKAVAQDMLEIFYELYRNDYQIEQIRLIDEYSGDDTLSMADNNTSCFNYRVVDGTDSLSKHAYGLAIDINPFYNPYVVFNRNADGSTYISPPGSEVYADRSKDFAYKIDENDLCYKLFKEHGFTWGGDWNSCKDYQHFQKALN